MTWIFKSINLDYYNWSKMSISHFITENIISIILNKTFLTEGFAKMF